MADTEGAVARRDRARAFVPELLPEPQDIERTGPLTPKEQQTLDRVHAARDHHQVAKWMRGKALAVAFSRQLYRGEDGQRTRQEYLDDEWDGISESAAYREIGEWPVAKAISDACERPAPDSHVRALVDVADKQGAESVARWYAELRRHGQQAGRRVTADVVANLADFLREGVEPERLEALFAPRQLAPAAGKPSKSTPGGRTKRGDEAVVGTIVPHSRDGSFPNLGMSADGASPAEEGGRWVLSVDHVERLSAWITSGADRAQVSPDQAADLLLEALTSSDALAGLDALTSDDFQRWIAARDQV
ncbi:hypothetical protein CP967_00025 [Streptomyces nitrosporeus]|uniref:Uncharacterized protein n=1 Tax=Streptomyces nitrosporeus TaxID=28894 RepID=A0A5J6F3P7_9ACTN|nr:hypothetical protein [Streptomyces nitrosporeus]QEU70566.1 hypothetical protein CP967_00025 [Streptomyces nitrosporeus]GGZ30139.1 hypothetical protein GCM10010327_70450 [Streptomyces nitrosporeus]